MFVPQVISPSTSNIFHTRYMPFYDGGFSNTGQKKQPSTYPIK